MLVEIGADNLGDLKKRLVDDMHPIEGIRWSESHFVTEHYYRGPKSQ